MGVSEVGLLGIEEPGGSITFFGEDESVLQTADIPAFEEDNSFRELGFDVMGVSSVDITLIGSGAVTNIDFTVADSSGLGAAPVESALV